jgi:hypothetical protein
MTQTCACEWKDGKVINCCGAHWEYIRYIQSLTVNSINADLIAAAKVAAGELSAQRSLGQPNRAESNLRAAIAKAEGKA